MNTDDVLQVGVDRAKAHMRAGRRTDAVMALEVAIRAAHKMDTPPPDGPRSGETYDDPRDRDRLNRQSRLVWQVIRDAQWHTLAELSEATGEPEASVSARLRDFRKARFGSHIIEREYVANGLWKYRWQGTQQPRLRDEHRDPCLHCFNDPPVGHSCPVCGRNTP